MTDSQTEHVNQELEGYLQNFMELHGSPPGRLGQAVAVRATLTV
jgi:hypothetical protein